MTHSQREDGFSQRSYLRVLSSIMLILGILSAPLALVTHWADSRVLDNQEFSSTIGALADEPVVKDFVVAQSSVAITNQLDLSSIQSNLGQRLPGWLPSAVTDRLENAGQALESGISRLISESLARAVDSEIFPTVWERGIQSSHAQALDTLQNEPQPTETVQADTLSLDIGLLLEQVKADLLAQQVPAAQIIPDMDLQVILLEYSGVEVARNWVGLVESSAQWLPWLSVVLLLGGVLLHRAVLPLVLGLLALIMALSYGLVKFVAHWLTDWAVNAGQQPDFVNLIFDELTRTLSQQLLGLAILFGAFTLVLRLVQWIRSTGTLRQVRFAALAGNVIIIAAGLLILLGSSASWW